jgi:hypothetical protein
MSRGAIIKEPFSPAKLFRVGWLIRRNFLFTYVLIGFTFVDAAGSGPARIVHVSRKPTVSKKRLQKPTGLFFSPDSHRRRLRRMDSPFAPSGNSRL